MMVKGFRSIQFWVYFAFSVGMMVFAGIRLYWNDWSLGLFLDLALAVFFAAMAYGSFFARVE